MGGLLEAGRRCFRVGEGRDGDGSDLRVGRNGEVVLMNSDVWPTLYLSLARSRRHLSPSLKPQSLQWGYLDVCQQNCWCKSEKCHIGLSSLGSRIRFSVLWCCQACPPPAFPCLHPPLHSPRSESHWIQWTYFHVIMYRITAFIFHQFATLAVILHASLQHLAHNYHCPFLNVSCHLLIQTINLTCVAE